MIREECIKDKISVHCKIRRQQRIGAAYLYKSEYSIQECVRK